jgi:uncharacterized protein
MGRPRMALGTRLWSAEPPFLVFCAAGCVVKQIAPSCHTCPMAAAFGPRARIRRQLSNLRLVNGDTNDGGTSEARATQPQPSLSDAAWERILSRQLAWTQRVRAALLPIGLLVAAALTTGTPAAAISLAAVGCCIFVLFFGIAGRTARSWRFLERPDDLLIEHGILVRRQVVVPYGRMQFVDIKVGPLERMLGIATLQLHTAAAASDARIPGLAPARAEQLRDRLAARGEARLAGL